MLFKIAHQFIVCVYLICPIIVFWRAYAHRNKAALIPPLQRFRLTVLAGMAAGIVVCFIFSYATHGRMLFTQVLIAGYLATSLLFLLQGFDRLLWIITRRIFSLDRYRGPAWWYNLRGFTGLVLRAAVIFCIGLPYVLATVMTYRPRVGVIDNPLAMYHWPYKRVEFPATDGVRIVGWWIPSPTKDSTKTVLLCPGSNGDKASQLLLVKRLVPDGYNVLVIDFRAHGESGGQLCSFGALERNDVLGAMRWLRTNHPSACKEVAGLGVSTGAAALLAAAADPSPEGQNIDTIAVYDTFDRLDNEVASLGTRFVPGPLSWFVIHWGLPIASCQVGTDLSAFAPANDIKAIWPRPVLVIHGLDDEYIPFEQGQALYDAAFEPKMNFWINRCSHEAAIKSDAAARLVRRCFDSARRVI